MVKEAIVALKERTGSSVPAIAKYIAQKHPDLPANWKKTLAIQLKNLTKAGKLVKVKASFKLGGELKQAKPVRAPAKKTPTTVKKVAKPKAASKPRPKAVPKAVKSAKPSTPKKVATPAKSPAKKPLRAAPKVRKVTDKKPAVKKVTPKAKAPSPKKVKTAARASPRKPPPAKKAKTAAKK
ncbi:unnamed protein product [Closterium sp. Yama58-4]|nr:unnamed protein product [Closterium sp. Yama58-4]